MKGNEKRRSSRNGGTGKRAANRMGDGTDKRGENRAGNRTGVFFQTKRLMFLVFVLMICAVGLGAMVLRQDNSRESVERTKKEQELQSGSVSENGADSQEKKAAGGAKLGTASPKSPKGTEDESGAENGIETKAGSEDKLGEGKRPETVVIPAAETELVKELEAGEEVNPGTGTKPETEKESEIKRKPGTEDESESETEAVEKLVVAIDPGHQGSWVNMSDTEPNGPGSSEMKAKASTGTQSPFSGKAEYELNLEISLLLRDELEKRGYEVILTREDHDTAISNSERALMAYEKGGDIYVRIHANGSDNPGVSGALAMVPSASNPYIGNLAADSYLLADCILNGYCEKASFSSLGVQYYDNMTGINWSKLPVMILEMGFMTNQEDDQRMADAAVQPLMAAGIADGIDRYFIEKGLRKKTVSREDQKKMDEVVTHLEEELITPATAQGEQWSVSILDLETGAEGSIDGSQELKSASIIKVFIMAAIYDRICYPASEERYISFPESYEGELKQKITEMITVSDNGAANLLIESMGNGDAQAGMAVVNQFCEENGYTGTHLGRKFLEANPAGDNYTSADDCCRLLESIYRGTCVNAEASAKMLAYLQNQTRRNKIPAGLSGTGALVANKTGELAGDYGDYVENDIAVVEEGGAAYILCVMSNGVQDNGAAISRISDISGMTHRLMLE